MLPLSLAVRELGRRALRSALTAGGIAIGVAALVLLGALAEKITRLVTGGRDFAMGQITVSGAGTGGLGGMMRGALVSSEQLAALRAVPGVAVVAPIVMFPLTDAPTALPFTLAPLVFGVDVEVLQRNHRAPPPRVEVGRLVPRTDRDEVVLGSQVALALGAKLGTTVPVRGRPFEVVGILEPTLTGPDSFLFMPYATAQRLLLDAEPLLRRLALAPGANLLPIATAAAAFWETGADPEMVARGIRDTVPGLAVVSPADAAQQLDRTLAIMSSLILGSALVALVVASLAVTNTMFTAVIERRREIGLRRVVGATRGQVVAQLVLEAAALGYGGSLLGLGAGIAAVSALNAVTARLGAPLFLLTPRLTTVALLLPPMLAMLAAVWPAWRAARRSPTESLRYT